jgi:hypothetical protein
LELGNPHDPGSLLEHVVATMGTEITHCWLTTIASDNIIASMTFDNTVALWYSFQATVM